MIQEPPAVVSISDSLKALPAVKEGFFYDFSHNRGLNVLGLEVVQWKGISLDAAWIGIDGIGVTIDYSLSSLPVQTIPVLNYVQYLNVGYGVGYRTITSSVTDSDPKADNEFIQGPVVYLKLKF